jgi:hypothetical protein
VRIEAQHLPHGRALGRSITVTTKDEIYAIVDSLTEDQLEAARQVLLDLAIPEDDEPLTADELAAIDRMDRARESGSLIPHDQLRRRRGTRP